MRARACDAGRCFAATALALAAIVASTGTADARPKRRDAKAAFDRGLAAYQKGNYVAAATALSQSFELERDADTLFAWAQSERKLERCDKALELYETVLRFELPPKNREAVERSIADCRALVAAQQPAEPAPVAPPAPVEPAPVAPVSAVSPSPANAVPPPLPRPPPQAWYRDPLALALLGTGVVATGIGTGLLVYAHSLDEDSRNATTIDDARRFGDQARSRGNIGLVTLGAGGALVIAGVVRIVLHHRATERAELTAWSGPQGSRGLAITGAF